MADRLPLPRRGVLHRAAALAVAALLPPGRVWAAPSGVAPAGERALPGAGGLVLPARVWPAQGPVRGTILALHGFNDCRNAWAIPAPVLCAGGYRIVAPDQRGFGATPMRGAPPDGAALAADARAMLAALRQDPRAAAGRRLILLGESMGGAVAMRLAADPACAGLMDAVVLSAPAVWGFGQMGWGARMALHLARALAPRWRPDPRLAPEGIVPCDNPDALRAILNDPLCLQDASVAALAALAVLMEQAAGLAPRLLAAGAPVLALAGARDRVVPPLATARMFAQAPGGVRRAIYPRGYHLLLRDLARGQPLADILAWLERPGGWLPSGADAAYAAWVAGQDWRGGAPAGMPASALEGWLIRRAYWW